MKMFVSSPLVCICPVWPKYSGTEGFGKGNEGDSDCQVSDLQISEILAQLANPLRGQGTLETCVIGLDVKNNKISKTRIAKEGKTSFK